MGRSAYVEIDTTLECLLFLGRSDLCMHFNILSLGLLLFLFFELMFIDLWKDRVFLQPLLYISLWLQDFSWTNKQRIAQPKIRECLKSQH